MSKHDHGGHHGGSHDDSSHDDSSHDDSSQNEGTPRAGAAAGTQRHSRPYPRLEDCDLSLKLSKDGEAKRLGKEQRRLLHLRLINGGQLNE